MVLICNEDYDWSLYGMKMNGPYMERRLWLVLIWNEDDWSLYRKKIVICPYMEWRCWLAPPYLEWWFVLKSWWQQEMKEDKDKFYRKRKRKRRKDILHTDNFKEKRKDQNEAVILSYCLTYRWMTIKLIMVLLSQKNTCFR